MRSSRPPLIDCHLHLQDPCLLGDLDAVLSRARAVGVRYFVANGSEEGDWDEVLAIARRHPGVIPCFGLHPWYVGGRSARWLEELERRLRTLPSGVGEIGLDRWKRGLDERAQEEVFRAQLSLARSLRRPVMVHCLDAWGWLLGILHSQPPPEEGLLVHAFGGASDLIRPLADLGAYFSFAGDTLDERRTRKRASFREVPLDRLLVETDAPDILPPPQYRPFPLRDDRGKEKTDPSALGAILRGLAHLRGETEERLAEAVLENARRLLGAIFPGGGDRRDGEDSEGGGPEGEDFGGGHTGGMPEGSESSVGGDA
jgi:TatD DNase family protein